ncbi:hypothetical protein U1Q18_011338 [Sarracenia purpurea var. burkii]
MGEHCSRQWAEEVRIPNHPPQVIWGLYISVTRVEPCPLVGTTARELSRLPTYSGEEFDVFRLLSIECFTTVCRVPYGLAAGARSALTWAHHHEHSKALHSSTECQ